MVKFISVLLPPKNQHLESRANSAADTVAGKKAHVAKTNAWSVEGDTSLYLIQYLKLYYIMITEER